MPGKTNRRGWGHIRRLPSGKYQASYIGPDLMRHSAAKTYTARMDAEAWIAAERRSIELDAWTPPAQRVAEVKAKAITLSEYASTWIAERSLKPRTRIGYQAHLDQHIEKPLGRVPLKNLTPETIRTWFAGLGSEHKRRNSQVYGLLHAILATAVGDGLIVSNPANLVGVMNPPTKRQPVILEVGEVAALADAIEPKRLRALILVSAWIGVRWGEAVELRRRDIGEGCKSIRVSRAVTHRDGCRVDTPKSGKGRAVIVPPHIRADLQYHLDTYVAKDDEALLFPAVRGCHLNDRVFRDYLAPALKSVGRESMTIHDLRHFAGTQAARVGNLVETMARLGHTTVKASMIYQSIASGRDVEVADALSELVTAATKAELEHEPDAELPTAATSLG